MLNTKNLNAPLVASNQAQKEVTVNTSLAIIDSFINNGAVDKDVNIPPVSPQMGGIYIIGDAPTDDWLDNAGDVAFYLTSWNFVTPNEGFTIWVNTQDKLYSFNGTNWVETVGGLGTGGSGGGGASIINDLIDVEINALTNNNILQYDGSNFINKQTIDSIDAIGINTTSDSNNKLSVNSDNVLFNNNGANSRVNVNKNLTSDTASHIFQTNFSGRAEFGTIGDDDFQVKVSPDGANWNQSYVVSANTGDISFKNNIVSEGEFQAQDNIISRAELKDYSKTLISPSSSSGTLTLNVENGNVFEVTLTENISSFDIINPSDTGKLCSITLLLKQDFTGGRVINFPSSFKWSNGVIPTLSTDPDAMDILEFLSTDGGSSWHGIVQGSEFAFVNLQPFSPLDITNIAAWLDASDASTISEGVTNEVSSINDKSGNNNHFVSTSNREPLTNLTSLNGLNVLDFNASNNTILNMPTGLYSLPNGPLTIFIVPKQEVDQNFKVLFSLQDSIGDPFGTVMYYTSGSRLSWRSGSGIVTGNSNDTTNFNIFAGTFDGISTVNLYSNGINIANNPTGGSLNPDIDKGFVGSSSSTSADITGSIAEMIMFDKELNGIEREKIEGYLAHKWGLTVLLNSSHPYKNSAPT